MKFKLESKLKNFVIERRDQEDSLKNMASAYNKNRTVAFGVIDWMELAVHDFKYGMEKRNVK
jgi:hypothetical protein